jgi:hypothetical protein
LPISSPPQIRSKSGQNAVRKNYLKKIHIVNWKMKPHLNGWLEFIEKTRRRKEEKRRLPEGF